MPIKAHIPSIAIVSYTSNGPRNDMNKYLDLHTVHGASDPDTSIISASINMTEVRKASHGTAQYSKGA